MIKDRMLVIQEPLLKLSSSLEEILGIFAQHNYRSLPVQDSEGKYIGVIDIKEILSQFKSLKVEDNIIGLIKPVVAVSEEDSMEIMYNPAGDIVPIVNSGNNLVGFVTVRDIVDYNNDFYKSIAEQYMKVIGSAYNGILAINNEGIVFVYNPAAERIIGRCSNDVLGKHISVLDPAMGLLETLVSGSSALGVKLVLNGKSIMSNRTPLMYQGHSVGAMGVFQDMTEVEKLTEDLDKYKAMVRQLDGIIESSYDGLYICDNKGLVNKVNTAWERICGYSRENIIGRTAYELIEHGIYNKSAAVKALESKRTSTVMLEMTAGPKKNQKIMATGTPIIDDAGEVQQVVVNVRDITELVDLKKQLDETIELSKHYEKQLEEIRLQQLKIDDLIAQSPAMQRILDLVIRLSQVESTVLITGESGVGKEVIAKKIHGLSKRQNMSLIKINCGAIPENLLESELFGYEGGSFTGAKKEGKPGLFELASGGTLFLDEIGELPLSLQVKLLRAVQEREINRVGGLKPIPVDVRIIAATNKDLASMVVKGTFREDLFYRLNVVSISIPPLRRRKEDIPPLLHSVLSKFNDKYNQDKKLTESVVDKLLSYEWPGNIRELENLIERLVVLINEPLIQLKHLPDFMQDLERKRQTITVNGVVPLKQAIEDMESQLIEIAIKEHGSTRKVAKILEVNQSTIVRKIRYYNIGKMNVEPHQDDVWVHHLRI